MIVEHDAVSSCKQMGDDVSLCETICEREKQHRRTYSGTFFFLIIQLKLRCCGWNVTFSPHITRGFVDTVRARAQERKRHWGEAEYSGSQASGSIYRMTVVNIHTAGHESSQTRARSHKLKCEPTCTFPQVCYRERTVKPTVTVKTSDLFCFFFTHPHPNIAGVGYKKKVGTLWRVYIAVFHTQTTKLHIYTKIWFKNIHLANCVTFYIS